MCFIILWRHDLNFIVLISSDILQENYCNRSLGEYKFVRCLVIGLDICKKEKHVQRCISLCLIIPISMEIVRTNQLISVTYDEHEMLDTVMF